MSKYSDTVQRIFRDYPAFRSNGAAAYHPGLDATLALAARFGNPHSSLRCIHIAGTNGKGTTAHTLAAVLQASGLKTALYTSPHIADFRERMMINGDMIPEQEVVNFMAKIEADTTGISFFELTTVMAFDWFARNAVDIAVIETGLGGRLDATNIITPELSIITNISLDHTAILGPTLEAIAAEKAGIIKPGVPVVVGEAPDPGVRRVIAEKARTEGCTLLFADDTRIRTSCSSDMRISVDASPFGHFTTALHGPYQAANARTVLASLMVLGFTDKAAVMTGFNTVERTLHGRWQMHKGVLCDPGHNPAAWSHTSRYLAEHASDTAAILGFCADKDIDSIIAMLPAGVRYFCTASSTPRAVPPHRLASMLLSRGLDATPCPSPREALEAARASGRTHIFLGGSFYILAEAFPEKFVSL